MRADNEKSHARSLKRYTARLALGSPGTDDPRDVAEELLLELESKRDADVDAIAGSTAQTAGEMSPADAGVVVGTGKKARKARRKASKQAAAAAAATSGEGQVARSAQQAKQAKQDAGEKGNVQQTEGEAAKPVRLRPIFVCPFLPYQATGNKRALDRY